MNTNINNLNPDLNVNDLNNQPPKNPVPEVDLPRPLKILFSLGVGSLLGYGVYGLACLANKYNWISTNGALIRPFPYVLAGFVNSAIVETASLTYDAALYVLGDRKADENKLEQGKELSGFDHLRQRVWKVIGKVEKIQQDVDTVFSRTFGIRTEKQIEEEQIQDRDLALVEIARRAFKEQCKETISSVLPFQVATSYVTSLGYTLLLVPQLTVGLHALFFWCGIFAKVTEVYSKIQLEELKNELNQEPNPNPNPNPNVK